jgi:hypothetical protein
MQMIVHKRKTLITIVESVPDATRTTGRDPADRMLSEGKVAMGAGCRSWL